MICLIFLFVLISRTKQKHDATPTEDADEWLGPTYDDTDAIVLHRFCEQHADKIGKELLSASKPAGEGDGSVGPGKKIWDIFCAKLIELGQPPDVPQRPTVRSDEHDTFLTLMAKFTNAKTDSVEHIFKHASFEIVSFSFPYSCTGHSEQVAGRWHCSNIHALCFQD